MSYGGYEARVGTPKLLELLDQLDFKATFFVTGWSVDAHPAMAEAILKAGHEIGHHGYHHLLPDPGDPWIEEELERGFEALKRRLGVKPTGYRAPYGEFTEELRVALVRHGIVYTSSFRDDVRPYRHRLADGRPGTIELPVTASYDDWMHGLSARFSPRPIFPKEHVLSIWKDELDEVRDWGAMVTTVLHPQCSGRPMRLRLLREFLTYAKSCPDLWITTGEAIMLRPADIDGAAGAIEEIARIAAQIRATWPHVRIILRADSGFARDGLMAWCEGEGVDFIFGLAKNARLNRAIGEELAAARQESQTTGQPARRFKDLIWSTRKSWSRRRRVIGKAEWTQDKSNPRFVVTSLTAEDGDGGKLYEQVYCARGEMENRIKECQLDLFAGRTSTATMKANQLRLWFASMAYVLVDSLRRRALATTDLANATCGTIRLKLLKIGARVTISIRRIRFAMASGCPYKAVFATAHWALSTAADTS
jgi:peptidoglycan/xylan/chitin deacetylase (PgdA/CDA1 family)